MLSIAEKVKRLRMEKGLSQQKVAEEMTMSRPTYMMIESGKRQLTVMELKQLAAILGSSLEAILFDSIETSASDTSLEKYKQLILNCLHWGSDKRDHKVTKTKLAKLVYLVDFTWFHDHGESISGLSYRRIQQGPVPDQYFRIIDELFGRGDISIQPSGTALMISAVESTPPTSELSFDELALIKKIGEKWQNSTTREIVDFTHEQTPWKSCRQGELVPYDLILQEKASNLY